MGTTSSSAVHIREVITETLRTELPGILNELLKAHSLRNPSGDVSTLNRGKLMTRKEVALRLSQSVQTVARLLSSGALPYTRIRRSVLIKEADLLAFIASRSEAKAVA